MQNYDLEQEIKSGLRHRLGDAIYVSKGGVIEFTRTSRPECVDVDVQWIEWVGSNVLLIPAPGREGKVADWIIRKKEQFPHLKCYVTESRKWGDAAVAKSFDFNAAKAIEQERKTRLNAEVLALATDN